MKKWISIIIVLLSAFVITACSEKQTTIDVETLSERGYLIVGLDDAFAPMGFRNEQNELVGFDVDLAKEVGSRLGIEIRFQPIDWDAKVLELNSGKIDMIWNGLTITDSRKEEMSFSLPYLSNRQIVITLSDSSVQTLNDLAGLEVGVQISSASEEAVKASDIVSSLGSLIQYDTYTQALLDLKNGNVDAIVIDEIMGRYMLSQVEDTYKILEENFGSEEYGIGFRLEDTLLRDLIDQTLNQMYLDGTTEAISLQWFNEDIYLQP